jgi:hypothetical protein
VTAPRRTALLAAACVAAATLAAPTAGAAASKRSFSLGWVGDISLSRHYGLPPHGGRALFAGLNEDLRSTDLTVGNMEGTLGSGGASKCGAGSTNCFAFQAPSSYAGVFDRAGFDLMNVANNHALDFGPSGQRQTLAALKRRRIAYTGRPGEIRVRRVNGVKVAFVGFAPYPWAASLKNIPAAEILVRRAGRKADVVVALIHAGAEGADKLHTPRGSETAFGENRGNTRGFAHAVVRAGADLVLGSGPHVVRGMERYRGRLIAYSLGNFLGYHTFSTGGVLSLSGILQVRVSARGRPLGGRWLSIRLLGPGVPRRDRSRRSARLVRSLSRQDFGGDAFPMAPGGRLRAPRR